MSATLSEPRYGISITLKDTANNSVTKSFNYVNLKMGGASVGYDANDVYEFASAVASLTGGSYNSAAITAQFNINPDIEP